MSLTPSTRRGPYEVTAQIGVGGTGEVYRALNTNLGRQVAIKILPDTFAHDPERLVRFEREAVVGGKAGEGRPGTEKERYANRETALMFPIVCVVLWTLLNVLWLLPHLDLSLQEVSWLGLAAAICAPPSCSRSTAVSPCHVGRRIARHHERTLQPFIVIYAAYN